MKKALLNYRHLYYFWMTAKEGTVTKAAERIGVAVQTISMQLSLLEKSLGKVLFAQQGRHLVVTEAGRVAMEYADRIFLLGEQMQETMQDMDIGGIRLTVGVSDSLPKTQIVNLLSPAMQIPQLHIECYEGGYDHLLEDLALHRLDLVLGQKPADISDNIRYHNQHLCSAKVWIFGIPELAEQYRHNFPQSLNGAPFLMPTKNHAVRIRLNRWFDQEGIKPKIVGEFSDSALLKVFASSGIGLFHAPYSLRNVMKERYHSVPVGEMEGMEEKYYAIYLDKKINHVGIERILAANQAYKGDSLDAFKEEGQTPRP